MTNGLRRRWDLRSAVERRGTASRSAPMREAPPPRPLGGWRAPVWRAARYVPRGARIGGLEGAVLGGERVLQAAGLAKRRRSKIEVEHGERSSSSSPAGAARRGRDRRPEEAGARAARRGRGVRGGGDARGAPQYGKELRGLPMTDGSLELPRSSASSLACTPSSASLAHLTLGGLLDLLTAVKGFTSSAAATSFTRSWKSSGR